MDVNNFYKEVFEQTLGLDVLGLEAEYQTLVKLIESKTIVTFSNYIPALYLTYLDLSDRSNVIRDDHNTLGVEFYLEDPVLNKFNLPILGIEKIDYNNTGESTDPYNPDSSAYYSSVIASRNNLTLDGLLMGSEYSYNLTLTASAYPWNRYFELRGPHTLFLRNYAFGGTAEITVKTRYPNLVSIPEEYREILVKLACLDIKVYLWNSLRYLENIVTPTGNLSLQFDWSSAESDREDFLKDLRNRSFADRVSTKYFMII